MLGKLIKHEFKSVSNVMLLINSCTLLLSLIGCLSFVSPLWDLDNEYIPFMAASSVIVYYIALVAISFASIIYLSLRFYKNLYTDEGYLMHTLPAAPRQLILSKGITAFCWIFITACIIGFSIVSILLSACVKFLSTSELQLLLDNLPSLVEEIYGISMLQFLLITLGIMLISTASSLLMIYAALSLGQLFPKHKILSSVGCYVLLLLITQVLSMIIMAPYMVKMGRMSSYELSMYGMNGYFNYIWIATTLLSLVTGVIYYFITEYIMTNKLNLE